MSHHTNSTTNNTDRTPPEYSHSEQAPGPVPYTTQQEGRPPVYPAAPAPGQPYPAPSGTPASEYGYSGHRGSTSFPDTMMGYRSSQSHPSNGVPSSNSMSGPGHAYPHPAYSSYAPPPPDVTSPYQHSGPSAGLYAQPRPDWATYQQNGPMQGHAVFPPTHSPAPAQTRQNQQVYSFVPIPGSTQHKRPRRRFEEIERMYKCGWNGCEKAYGTLNHLNAHVTMQSHGTKRTPEEFKEIRKEWKARKKEEEAQRKAAEERARAASTSQSTQSTDNSSYAARGAVQLPPIGSNTPVSQYPLPEYNGPAYQNYPPGSGSPYHPNGYSTAQHANGQA
ncbi:hypothetical protein NCU07846 [Neurospora crassa OR74A]|uniref:C2H2-type domain-containing protein n=1 Tax=Neurospora crassa (strain ATCC 24698 / 74-OR23-1A / CBS 708.71 / DSM 1257 / FGSC 987) TaxID=367110 RepID=U9WGD4_NEUCR|nr:hypothetical protein NCU07846 [Neurospora crassa OR74A]ESA43148.1 hypothetical protein NCU07846 [Neurospora crassa OR74A]|eukprot:XP_011393947.1 hypothetical protein NCU07846 [Neurospora crassa OR74A]